MYIRRRLSGQHVVLKRGASGQLAIKKYITAINLQDNIFKPVKQRKKTLRLLLFLLFSLSFSILLITLLSGSGVPGAGPEASTIVQSRQSPPATSPLGISACADLFFIIGLPFFTFLFAGQFYFLMQIRGLLNNPPNVNNHRQDNIFRLKSNKSYYRII